MVRDTRAPGHRSRAARHDPPREPRGRQARPMAAVATRATASAADRLFVPRLGHREVPDRAAQTAVELGDARGRRDSTLERPSYADFEIMDIPADADPEAVAAELARAARRRVRAAALSRTTRCCGPTIRSTTGSGTSRRSTWNAPGTFSRRPAARSSSRCSTPASRSARPPFATTRASRSASTPDGPVYPPLGIVDVPFAVAPELGDAKFVSPRDFIWDDDLPFDLDGHGTHVSGTVGQLTNNGVGVAGMAYNVRIMPVKVIDEVWDFIFDSPEHRHRRHGRARHPLRRRQRRQGDQHEHRPHRRRPGDRGRGGHSLRRRRAACSSRSPPATPPTTGNAPSRTAEAAPNIDGMVAVAAVGRALRARVLLDDQHLRRDRRARRRPAARRQHRRHPAADASIRICCTPICSDRSAIGRRAPTSFAYYFFQGTSMATPHVSAFAAMLMQQGITSPRGDRSRDEAVRARPRPRRRRQRVRRRSDPAARRRCAASDWPGSRCRSLRIAVIDRVRLVLGALVLLPRATRPAVLRRARSRTDDIGVRGFAHVRQHHRSRPTTASTPMLGTRQRPIFGGGGQVLLPWGLYVEVAASQFSRDGERVFIGPNDEVFQLGHSASSVTITPLEVTGGYRYPTRRGGTLSPVRVGGLGYSSYRYKETSEFAEPGEDVDERFSGFHVLGGAEYQPFCAGWPSAAKWRGRRSPTRSARRRRVGGIRRGQPRRHDASGSRSALAADTPFTRRVLSVVRRIPVGRVTTYGTVARLAGKPRAARAVGNIMREARAAWAALPPRHRRRRSAGRLRRQHRAEAVRCSSPKG